MGGRTIRLDSVTGNSITSGCGTFLLYGLLMFCGLLMLGGLAGIFGGGNSVGVGLIFFLVGLLSSAGCIITLKNNNKAEKRAYNIYKYHCDLCGFNWEWREGQPLPKVNVNPDLIARGAKKLEEEEQQRQQQAALHYLSQQNKK